MHGTEILFTLVGSVALLLWGVRMVRTGVTRAFGAGIRRVIAASTRNRWRAFLTGLGITAFIQSSTATTLIVSSFASRSLIAAPAALAVVLGADLGSTLAAQILSFDLGWLAYAAIAAGVFSFMGSRNEHARHMARIVIGLGLMLLSLKLIATASAPLRGSPAVVALLGGLAGEPIVALIIGAIVTWLAHSTLAIVLLVASLAGAQVTPIEVASALVIGANIGGAFAPFVSQTGAAPAARRVPLGNLIMRAATAVLAVATIGPALTLLSKVTAEPARLLINFHTAFNLACVVLFIGVVPLIAKLCERILPDTPSAEDVGRPRYLDPALLEHPAEALACAARETLALGDHVAQMLRKTIEVLTTDDQKLMRSVEASDDAVDRLHEAIKLYLIQVSRAGMSEVESRRYVEILSFVTNLEHVGDIIDKNLMELAAKKIRNRVAFSSEGLDELKAFHARVLDNLQLAFNVFMSRDPVVARRLLREKTSMREAELSAADSHFRRLRQGRPESIESSAIHLDVVRDLKRINSHLTSVAYPILEATGELSETRLRDTPGSALGVPVERPGT
ncbi:MAG: Na/Pi cotransporter family protein [Alphaproteobacteria bacterium]|nr:Na/Pi cotransporter family protein [Alphaproteobacteria bacterium]